jgi:hypothetical protein
MKSDYWNVADEQVTEKTGKPLAHWKKLLPAEGTRRAALLGADVDDVVSQASRRKMNHERAARFNSWQPGDGSDLRREWIVCRSGHRWVRGLPFHRRAILVYEYTAG